MRPWPRRFGIDPGEPVYERARLVKAGNIPTHALTSYYLPGTLRTTHSSIQPRGPRGPEVASPSSRSRAWSRTT